MRRADRLFEIVQFLRGGRLLTAQALADRLEVSKRTIYRDILDLQASGVPIEGEAGVGYVLSSDYHVPPLSFTPDEIAALVLGARMVKAWASEDLKNAAEEALVKIDAVVPDGMRNLMSETQLYAMKLEDQGSERMTLDQLRLACKERRVIVMTYLSLEGQGSTRRVRPLGLYFWGRVWTLLSWCELRQDFRSFRVDHIEGLDVIEEHFPVEKGRELRDYVARMKALSKASS
ncbi:Predicted DNA-binding transcriptional regulator YafY, contains an HTH and WYL domains [Cohaesibacter sp. ES.047]|uniref:helix-turn-helix transcriptional regulator n=1 Tax=Cohaesibacter sp. ES.047 TaxID=1798205 RepID=UPI000BB8FB5B|nr:YafY family protein [Cohaesibacter sp. ES.047]SNY94190.1 Predicted DNA-binding transcriptional regulator YafY, contains an HTH and WYL domains [Cohaesibacter sp. ES.047]